VLVEIEEIHQGMAGADFLEGKRMTNPPLKRG